MWDSMKLVGDEQLLDGAVEDNSVVAVTDGSFIWEMYLNLYSAAFIFECSNGRGKLWGSFLEQTMSANAYQGELLELMALHLILLSMNKVAQNFEGSVHIYSVCLGALDQIKHLLLYQIPTYCQHLDILKSILVDCRDLTFRWIFPHVKTH